jgi:hypothetical protein
MKKSCGCDEEGLIVEDGRYLVYLQRKLQIDHLNDLAKEITRSL